MPIVLKGCHRQTYQIYQTYDKQTTISRYFQIFPDISSILAYSTRVVFAEGAERSANPAPSDGRPTPFEQHLVTDGPQAVNVCHSLHQVSRIRSKMLHLFSLYIVSICFNMFQITSETWSANSSVKMAVNKMQTGSLISGFLHCRKIQQVEPKNTN